MVNLMVPTLQPMFFPRDTDSSHGATFGTWLIHQESRLLKRPQSPSQIRDSQMLHETHDFVLFSFVSTDSTGVH